MKQLRMSLIGVAAALLFANITVIGPGVPGASADSHESLTTFEQEGFVDGASVNTLKPDGNVADPPVSGTDPNVQAWSVRQPGTDEEVVDISATDPEHGKVWRFSNGAESGNLQTTPHAPRFLGQAGETGAVDDFGEEPVTTNTYFASLDFRSATGEAQPGLSIDLVAACGDDCRQGLVRVVDDGDNGIDLIVYDTDENQSFRSTALDLDLSYGEWHSLSIAITFVDGINPDGSGNDVSEVRVDDELVWTGTTWESYYLQALGQARSIDRFHFKGGTVQASLQGNGLYFDNILITDVIPEFAPPATVSGCRSLHTGLLRIPVEGQSCAAHEQGLVWEVGDGSGNQVYACVLTGNRLARIVDAGENCPANHDAATWTKGDAGAPQIHVCVSDYTKLARIVSNESQCMPFESPVSWEGSVVVIPRGGRG